MLGEVILANFGLLGLTLGPKAPLVYIKMVEVLLLLAVSSSAKTLFESLEKSRIIVGTYFQADL